MGDGVGSAGPVGLCSAGRQQGAGAQVHQRVVAHKLERGHRPAIEGGLKGCTSGRVRFRGGGALGVHHQEARCPFEGFLWLLVHAHGGRGALSVCQDTLSMSSLPIYTNQLPTSYLMLRGGGVAQQESS